MNNEEIIKKIDELIGANEALMDVVTYRCAKELMQSNIDILKDAKIAIIESQYSYDRGSKDAWNLAFKISGSPDKGCYNNDELYEIFDCRSSCGVFDSYSYNTALRLVEEYEKKKDEATKLVPGDVIEFESIRYGTTKGVFIKYVDKDVKVLTRNGSVTIVGDKAVWKITKTGEHVDISGLIGVLYE